MRNLYISNGGFHSPKAKTRILVRKQDNKTLSLVKTPEKSVVLIREPDVNLVAENGNVGLRTLFHGILGVGLVRNPFFVKIRLDFVKFCSFFVCHIVLSFAPARAHIHDACAESGIITMKSVAEKTAWPKRGNYQDTPKGRAAC